MAASASCPCFCATLTVLLGLMTFIGWISGRPLLASVRAKYIPMAPSTALCFSLLGLGLEDIRRFSQREAFADDVCVVGVQVQHTE